MLKTQSKQISAFSEKQIVSSKVSYKKWIALALVCLFVFFATCQTALQGENIGYKPNTLVKDIQENPQKYKLKYDLSIQPKLRIVNGKQYDENLNFYCELEYQQEQLNIEEQLFKITYNKISYKNSMVSDKSKQDKVVSLLEFKETLTYQAKVNKDGEIIEIYSDNKNQIEVVKQLTKRIVSEQIKEKQQSQASQLSSKRILQESYTTIDTTSYFLIFNQEEYVQYEEAIADLELFVIQTAGEYQHLDDQISNDQDREEQIEQGERQEQQAESEEEKQNQNDQGTQNQAINFDEESIEFDQNTSKNNSTNVEVSDIILESLNFKQKIQQLNITFNKEDQDGQRFVSKPQQKNFTNGYIVHEGKNLQENEINKFSVLKLKYKNDDENITIDDFDHDGKNFQGQIPKKLKLIYKNDDENTTTNDYFDHDGKNFQDNNHLKKILKSKYKNEDQNITNDNWDHDGKNFQQDTSYDHQNQHHDHGNQEQENEFDNKDSTQQINYYKEVTVYKQKILSKILEIRIAQNTYNDYTKFTYTLYINGNLHSKIHEIIIETESIFKCIPKIFNSEEQEIANKIIEFQIPVLDILNISTVYQLKFLISHSFQVAPSEQICYFNFSTGVQVQVELNQGFYVLGQEEKGLRARGLLINEIYDFNFIFEQETNQITSEFKEFKKQKVDIDLKIQKYFRSKICNLKDQLKSTEKVSQQLRKRQQYSQEAQCHLSDLQDIEDDEITFIKKNQIQGQDSQTESLKSN